MNQIKFPLIDHLYRQLSTSVSIDYSSHLTKDESIIETSRDPHWNLNFGRLTNASSVPNISSNNCSQCVQNFHSPTDLHNSVPDPPSQTQISKSNKSDSHQYYDNIIKDVLSDCSFSDSQNPEAKQLHDKASMLAPSALTDSTKSNYDKAWARFLNFCDKMGYHPMDTSQ